MSDDIMRRQMALLKNAAPERQVAVINKASVQHLLRMDANFENWAHRNQLPPRSAGWRTWLMMAGRGFGKTRAGAEWIHSLASGKPGVRVALVGATIADARSIMVEGVSGLLSIAKANKQRVTWEPSSGRLTWPNGSQAQTFSGDSPNGLRGPEFDFAWADELAKWREPEASWDNLQMALRRGQRPRVLVTTTPRPMELLERIRAGEWTVTTTGRTSQNINLDKRFIDIMTATYGGTRVGEQELEGVLFRNAEGALWTREILERARVMPGTLERVDVGGDPLTLPSLRDGSLPLPRGEVGLDRIVVGVDPPAGVGAECDACGIVVAGTRGEKYYVLEDASVQGLSPEGWANRVAAAAARWDAQLIVAEANNGGAMVESVINAAGGGLKVRLVHASKGKSARAEPIALRFEAGRAFLAGRFTALENELVGMQAGGGYDGPGRSPDRADAMVWALTALSETRSGVPRVRRL